MERLADWLKQAFKMDAVTFVEKHSHGHLCIGNVQELKVEFLVVTSGHVWKRSPGERSWSTTSVYVPDRGLF